jgi:hypothetical protein
MRKEDASRCKSEIVEIMNAAAQTKQRYQITTDTSVTTEPPLNRKLSTEAEPIGKLLTEADLLPSNVRQQGNGPDDVKPWLARLGARARMVCAISVPHTTIRGTGFLIGPDLVLTCFHVIRPIVNNPALAGNLEIIFDRESRPDRTGHEPGVSYHLAEDGWLGSFSLDDQPLDKEGLDETLLGQKLVGETLDFAVLRIEGRPGDDRRGGPVRGWINLEDKIEGEHGLLVAAIHHPDDTRLLLSFGAIVSPPDEKGLLSHNARSFDGSSGALIVNNFGRFVALHRGDADAGQKTDTLARKALSAVTLSDKIKEEPPRSPVD